MVHRCTGVADARHFSQLEFVHLCFAKISPCMLITLRLQVPLIVILQVICWRVIRGRYPAGLTEKFRLSIGQVTRLELVVELAEVIVA